jgi:1-phosphatidylinositol phosphodiesterase
MLVSTIVYLGLSALASASPSPLLYSRSGGSVATHAKQSSLASLALDKVLHDATPVFGVYEQDNASESRTARWMSDYDDSTLLVHMNLPGTHDTATWNYSLATQESLMHVTNLSGLVPAPWDRLRCQDLSIITSLEAGIRVFDLRFAADVTNSTLVFYHNAGLQSQTATVEDVLFAFYAWLDEHPSEAVLLSFQYEGSTGLYASEDAWVQRKIYDILTSPHAQKYFVQRKDELGTLGEARGKITLLRRFDMLALPASDSSALPGLHLSPANWTDNSPDIALMYNTAKNLTAYIEDYYGIMSPANSSAALNIQWKYNATTAHLLKAASEYPDSLFWSFASSEDTSDIPVKTPRIMAAGNGTALTPLGGVNQRLLTFLQQNAGKRFGIVMFDFYEQPGDLITTFLSL